VYEHITGGGCVGAPLPDALLSEAALMLRALLKDLNAAGCRVAILGDERLELSSLAAAVHAVGDADQRERAFDDAVRASDATWVIAPETGGVLESLSRRVLLAGRQLLGSRPEAVGVAASKYETARRLDRGGVPVVPTFRSWERMDVAAAAWVAKPDDGCGCQDTRMFSDSGAASAWIETRPAPARFVLQPYVRGDAASLSVLVRERRAWLLSVNRQHVVTVDQTFSFRGCLVNAEPDSSGRFQHLAQGIAEAIPGLWGYVGVDLILAASGPLVLEVNPRLTTSYAGLSAALELNTAALVLGLLENGQPQARDLGRRGVAVEVAVPGIEAGPLQEARA